MGVGKKGVGKGLDIDKVKRAFKKGVFHLRRTCS